jgi:hypothetical protein
MADPLAQFRREARAPEPAGPEAGQPAYKAFSAAKGPPLPRLDIRSRELGHCPAYSTLVDIVYDPSDDTGFYLTFSINFQVKVDGRKLRPVIDALKTNSCEFIEEYDAARFPAPETGATVIDRISLRVPRAEPKKD